MATVSEQLRSTTITLASPSAGPFLVGFRLFDTNTLDVFVDGERSTDWTLSSSFADGYDDAASITFLSTLPSTSVIVIDGALQPRRDDDYAPNDPNMTGNLNIELARIWSAISDIRMTARRSVRGFTEIDPADGIDFEAITQASNYAEDAEAAKVAAEAAAAEAQAAENSLLEWQGQWLTATAYGLSDIVYQAGNAYICVEAHTSGTFSTDLTAVKWELFAAQGASGPGTGDMLASQNLNDLADKPAARAVLGLGSVALLNEIAFAELAGAAVITASETIASNDSDVALPTAAAVKDYVDGGASAVIATTSGTEVIFTGIPAGVTEIDLFLYGVGTSASAILALQARVSGTTVSSGYSSTATFITGAATAAGEIPYGFYVTYQETSRNATGHVTLKRQPGTNVWTYSGVVRRDGTSVCIGAGVVSLAGALDGLRFATTAGTFNSNSIGIRWRF